MYSKSFGKVKLVLKEYYKRFIANKKLWFIYLLAINMLLRMTLRILSNNFFSYIILIILNASIFFIPYIYCLYNLSNTDNQIIWKKFMCNLNIIVVFYILYFLLFYPYSKSLLFLIPTVLREVQFGFIMLILILIIPSFYISIRKTTHLTIKEYVYSFTFTVLLQLLFLQLIVLFNSIRIIRKLMSNDSIHKNIINCIRDYSVINSHNYVLFMFSTIILTLVISIYVMKQGKNRLFDNKELSYSLMKILFNGLLVIMADFLSKKENVRFYISYGVLVLVMIFGKEKFLKWFKEYSSKMFLNTMQIFLIEAVLVFVQSDTSSNYLRTSFMPVLAAILIFYMTFIVVKYVYNIPWKQIL